MDRGRTPLHKSNLGWPLAVSSRGLKLVTRLARYSSALWHLLLTSPGSYWADPLYGASFELLRTQGVTPSNLEAHKVRLAMGISRYIPDIMATSVDASMDHETETLSVSVVWIVKSADPAMHGELARPQKTMVSY